MSAESEKKSETSRVWVVSELYYPEETSTGYYMTKIAEGLVGDLQVRALCGQPNYSRRGTKAPKRELHNGVEIFRTASTTLDKNIVLFRVINMMTLATTMLFTSVRRFRAGDQVLVVTTPPILPFVAAISSLVRGASYSLLVHDNYPEILIAVGKTHKDSVLAQFIGHINRWLYKHAAQIIVVGRDMQQLLERKTEGLDIPIVNIPNWAELETVTPEPRSSNALLRELGISDWFVLLYAGNMGHPNDIESIVRAAELMRDSENVQFVFLGTGAKRRWLENSVNQLALTNVTLLDPRPRSDQNNFLNGCDVALVSLVSGMKGVSMPSRTYNILAAGKPIIGITEEGSELDLVIKDDDVGRTVPPNRPEEIVAAIQQLIGQPDELRAMGMRARHVAEEKYSLETAVEAYRKIL